MKKNIYLISFLIFASGILLSSPSFAVKHVVSVGNFFFNPSSLNVNVGDTIRWVWSAGTHTTTSDPGGIPVGAASWDAPITSSQTSFEYKVTVAGSYSYVCTPHAPGMAGTFTAAASSPTLSVTPSNRNVPASSGFTTFTVSSNSSWTTSCNAGWCTVTSGGAGNGTINADYTANTSVSQRIATVTVMVSGLPSQTVTVTQAGAAATLSVGPPNQNVAASSGSTTFNVTSNTSWTSSSNASWCTATPSGSGNGIITANYSTNATNVIRTATINVTVSGLPVQSVTVTQAASTVGMNEHNLAELQVYPNPTKGSFRIKAASLKDQMLGVSITDMTGKTILTRTCSGNDEYQFDISGETPGLYFIRINTGMNTQVRRIVLSE
ncbi:MAG: BACON domain-containing carbohydrate-binding protein [bacterium]